MIPFVGFPSGSRLAKQNSIKASAELHLSNDIVKMQDELKEKIDYFNETAKALNVPLLFSKIALESSDCVFLLFNSSLIFCLRRT